MKCLYKNLIAEKVFNYKLNNELQQLNGMVSKEISDKEYVVAYEI